MIIFTLMCVFIGLLLYMNTRRPSRFPPGPPNLPLVGYLPFLKPTPHEKFLELGKIYGDVISINFGPFARLVVFNSYNAIRDAYKEDVFSGRPDTYFFHVRTEGYHGVAFNQGPDWQELRRFTLRVLRDFGFGKSVLEAAIVNEITELLKKIGKECGNPIELGGRFNLAVINTLWAITTGERFQLDNPEMNQVLKNLRRIISNVNIAGPMMFVPYSDYIPAWLIGGREFTNQVKYLKDLFQKEAARQNEIYKKDGLTDNLIKTFLEKIAQTEDSTSAFYGEEGMKNLVFLILDLFVAGSESVSSSLTWMILFLSKNPDIQDKVDEELDRVVGRERLPSLDDKPLLPYTEAVLMETNRIVSLAPMGFPHCVMADTEFRGYKIPKGTVVLSNLYAVHRDPQIWQKPDELNPQHFLDSQGKLKLVDQLIPFSVGKRSCLGESLAKMELFLFATHLFHTFRFSLPEDELVPSFMMKQSLLRIPPPIKIMITPR